MKNRLTRSAVGAAIQAKLRPFDWLMIGLLFSYVWRIQDLYPILGSLRIPILISLLALGFFAFEGHFTRARPRFSHPIPKLALFIFGWMVLSVPGGVYPGLSFNFILDDHVKTLLMMLMIISSIRGFGDVERLVVAQVVGAGIYCVKILTEFQVEASGRLGDLAYYDSNDLALLIVCTLPLAVYLISRGSKFSHRMVALGSAGVFVVAIVRTGSRGGFLGLIAVGIYLLLGFRTIPARIRLSSVVGCTMLLFAVAGPQYWTMMSTLLHPKDDYNWSGNNDVGRMAIWERGIGYIQQRPVLGVGANAFPVAEGMISEAASRQAAGIGFKWSAAHNSFIQIGAELGVPGIIAFLLMLGHAFKGAWSLGRYKGGGPGEKTAPLGQALVGTMIGYMVCGFFLSQGYSAYLYSMLAIISGLLIVTRAPAPQPEAAPAPVVRRRRPQLVAPPQPSVAVVPGVR